MESDPLPSPGSPMHMRESAAGTRTVASIILPVLLVLLLYVWFISAGLWTSWPPTAIYNYYNNLATAFRHGHLYLDDKPSPELLALPDPYRIGARKNIPYIWDATLYHGRYYLYWGPTPALIILPLRLAFPASPIGDNYLAFAFVCALYGALCLLIVRLWHRFFRVLPRWTLVLALLVAGLVTPLTWMLDRPEVYEAAIAAGQFFLLLGLYFLIRGLDSDRLSVGMLLLASACWGLAIGSRNSEALPVIFLVLAAAAWMYADRIRLGMDGRWRRSLSALLAPLAICAIGLGWYNWARFGSVAEFGYRYQLTLLQLPKHYNEIFSTSYIVPNLQNYFLNPFTVANSFPFVKPQYGQSDFSGQLALPRIYFSEAVTGLVYTFPFGVLALIPLASVSRRRIAVLENGAEAANQGAFRKTVLCLIGVTALEFASLILFFFATMRYLADVTPGLTLLSVIGFWQAYSWLSRTRYGRTAFAVAAACLVAVGITTSTLLAISSYQERFQTTNPALIQEINRLFFP